MNTYKYFFISDLNQEAIGKVKANDIHSARKAAATLKKLNLTEFVKLFNVEKLND
jgi:hypothetical protein